MTFIHTLHRYFWTRQEERTLRPLTITQYSPRSHPEDGVHHYLRDVVNARLSSAVERVCELRNAAMRHTRAAREVTNVARRPKLTPQVTDTRDRRPKRDDDVPFNARTREQFEAALHREAHRLCMRYIYEVVLPFGLCPWAEPALSDHRVEIAVITDDFSVDDGIASSASRVRALLDRVADSIDLVLIVLPRWHRSRVEMDGLLREFRNLPSPMSHTQSESDFAVAAFHPVAPFDTGSPERLIPYLRRSPDPLVQAVRNRALTGIEAQRQTGTAFVSLADITGSVRPGQARPPKSIRTKIAEANMKTVLENDAESFERAITAICRDREQTYRRLSHRHDTE